MSSHATDPAVYAKSSTVSDKIFVRDSSSIYIYSFGQFKAYADTRGVSRERRHRTELRARGLQTCTSVKLSRVFAQKMSKVGLMHNNTQNKFLRASL